jgi:HSP20 family molecular chaperone IbpA
MWSEMLALLARTDRLHGEGFGPAAGGWEPPIDVLETDSDLLVVIALPGVAQDEVEIVVAHGELPHGRFERRLPLPPGAYQLTGQEHKDGCLLLTMRKLG